MTKAEKSQIHQQVGMRLTIAREIAGLTQVQLSKRSGLGRAHIAMLETARCDLPVTSLIRLARALGVKPARLLP